MRLSDLDRMEFEFKVEDADLSKLAELLADVNIKETPWFDVSDKHGNSARYYREGQWIPCSERLPDGVYPVVVTWKNTDPKSYYQYMLGKHYVGVAHYKNGKWYWYSSVTEDVLMEYGRYDSEEFDEAIECMAWMPLPPVYRGDEK